MKLEAVNYGLVLLTKPRSHGSSLFAGKPANRKMPPVIVVKQLTLFCLHVKYTVREMFPYYLLTVLINTTKDQH